FRLRLGLCDDRGAGRARGALVVPPLVVVVAGQPRPHAAARAVERACCPGQRWADMGGHGVSRRVWYLVTRGIPRAFATDCRKATRLVELNNRQRPPSPPDRTHRRPRLSGDAP